MAIVVDGCLLGRDRVGTARCFAFPAALAICVAAALFPASPTVHLDQASETVHFIVDVVGYFQ